MLPGTHVLFSQDLHSPCRTPRAKTGAIDVKDNPASISDDGRFVTFMAGFESATLRGTREPPPAPVSRRHLFLYDAALGITWAVTREVRVVTTPLGDEFEAPIDIEALCCPTAPSSLQRGTCSVRNEMRQACCWQKPCFNPGACTLVPVSPSSPLACFQPRSLSHFSGSFVSAPQS